MTLQLPLLQKRNLIAFGVTVVLAAVLIFIVQLVKFNEALAIGFSLDFLVTVPLLYLFMIRKTAVPAITVVPLSLFMLLLAYWVMPASHQQYLEMYRLFALPLIELIVLAGVVVKVIKAGRAFKASALQKDVYYRLKQAVQEIVPVQMVASIIATEVSMFYYAQAAFRKPALQEGFSYHRETALGATMGALSLMVLIETIAVHFLLMQWSALAANLLMLGSLYSFVYLLAIIGASRHRRHMLTAEGLLLRFGLQETLIPLHEVESLEKLRGEVPEEEGLAKLGVMWNFNLILRVKEQQTLFRFYGIRNRYKILAFWADEPQALMLAYTKAAKGNKE